MADREGIDMTETNDSVERAALTAVRKKLGVPEGQSISIYADLTRIELASLKARLGRAVKMINNYDGYGAGMMFHDELRATMTDGMTYADDATVHPLGLDSLVELMLKKARDERWDDERCHTLGARLAKRIRAGDFTDEG